MTIKELRLKAQNSSPEAGRETYVGKTVRFFSIYLTSFWLRTSVTPNQITFLSVVVCLTGAGLFATGSFAWEIVGCFLIYFSVVLDACDGEIARLKGNKSGVGSFYTEPVSHDIQYGLMFLPMGYGLYLGGFPGWIIAISAIATISKLMHRFLVVRFEAVLRMKYASSAFQTDDDLGGAVLKFNQKVSFPHKVYRWFNRNIFSSVCLVVPLLISVLIRRVDLFLWFFAIGFSSIFILNFARQVRYISNLGK